MGTRGAARDSAPPPRPPERADFDLVMVCPHLGEGGAQRVIANLANAWSARGRRVCVVALNAEEPRFELDPRVSFACVPSRAADVSRTALPAGRRATLRRRFRNLTWTLLRHTRLTGTVGYYLYFARQIRGLRRLLRGLDAPVIAAFVGETNLVTLIAAAGLGRRLVISERNDPARERLDRIWNPLRPLLYRRADLVTANSRHAADWMHRYVPAQRLRVIPNPLADHYAAAHSVDIAVHESKVMLGVGRLHRQKGHDLLLRAFATLPPDLDDWRLVIAGEGEEREALAGLARSLGVAERVSFPGFVTDLRTLYRQAGLFVMASRYEGMSNALLEAMSQGLPAVVTDACPGSLELVDHGESGLVVPVGDIPALGEALAGLARDPGLRLRLGRAGRERTQAYRLERVIAQWEEVLAP